MSEWTIEDQDTGETWTKESRGKAESAVEMFGDGRDLEIIPPGDTATDGGPEVVEAKTEPEPVETSYDEAKLPEKPPVDEDPITWMPSDFTDTIDGTTVINRKGYEVMAHHYEIGTSSECLVGPENTDFTFCRVRATAQKPDGTTYTAHGSAHVERGDDSYLLLEMADTRARKRAIAQATGVGMVAVEEIRNKP